MIKYVLKGLAILVLTVILAVSVYNLTYSPLPEGVVADRVVANKSERSLTLYRGDEPLKTYKVALGPVPVGHKQFEGDKKTPEGTYVLDRRNPHSRFHLSIHVSYPDADDIAYAKSHGRSAGGDIMIHGLRNSSGFIGPLHRFEDWTAGCIAVTNAEIEEIWRAVPDGTPIEILP